MSEIEKLSMIAEWQEQYKQLIEDLDNSKKQIADLEAQIEKMKCCENCTHKYCSECKRKKVLSDVDYWELAD